MTETSGSRADASPTENRPPTKRTWVIHPFLFAVFPVLFVYAQNMQQFSPGVMLLPALTLLVCTGVLWGLLSLLLRNSVKAGLLTSLFLLLFFCYGPAWHALPMYRVMVWGVAVEPTKTVFLAWIIVLLVAGRLCVRTRKTLRKLTAAVNVAAATLAAISACQVFIYEIGERERSTPSPEVDTVDAAWTASFDGERPDIYYIIMDGYGGPEVLKGMYGVDNSGFLDFLRGRGFYVADGSTTNYPATAMSLASSLNMNTISALLPHVEKNRTDVVPLTQLIRHSAVQNLLRQLGYTIVTFSTGYEVTEVPNADIYLRAGRFSGEFVNALISMTPVNVMLKRFSPVGHNRTRILYTLRQLETLTDKHSPKFVFAHIMAPHQPFVFGRGGEPVNPAYLNAPYLGKDWLDPPGERERYRTYYADQLVYLNGELRKVVTRILDDSPRPPIIIIQGDHGPCSLLRPGEPTDAYLRERYPVLNAYYFPGVHAGEVLRRDITPVNSFRVLFNVYFRAGYPLLDDRNYMPGEDYYDLIDVTDRVRPTQKE